MGDRLAGLPRRRLVWRGDHERLQVVLPVLKQVAPILQLGAQTLVNGDARRRWQIKRVEHVMGGKRGVRRLPGKRGQSLSWRGKSHISGVVAFSRSKKRAAPTDNDRSLRSPV
jgi:hypothetical protein